MFDCLMEVAAWAGLTVINHSVNYTRFMLFMCNIIQINLDMYTNVVYFKDCIYG